MIESRNKHVTPAATLAVACAMLAACASGATTPAPTGVAPSRMVQATSAPSPGAILDELDAGGHGWAMTKAGGALWIQVDPPVDAIVRIDLATGATKSAVPLGWMPKSGPEGLWIVCCDWLVRVDPVTGKELLRIPSGGAFALADGAVWLMNDDGLHRIDPTSGVVGEPVGPSRSAVCDSSRDLAVAFESAWLACKEGTVIRIALSDGDVTSIPTAAGAHTFTIAEGAVWVTNFAAGSVSRIDPSTNSVTTIPGVGAGVGITSGGGFVWAATETGVAKIDPATNAIVGELDLGPGRYYELVWDNGIIWVSTTGSRVLKVDSSKTTQ
jgi:streptogramin lyase